MSDEFILYQTSGEAPAAFVWRHSSEKSAVDEATRLSRQLNAEFIICKIVGLVTRKTEWRAVNGRESL